MSEARPEYLNGNPSSLVALRRKLNDELNTHKKVHKEQCERYDAVIHGIDIEMKDRLNKAGVNSMTTDHGRVSLAKKVTISCTSWEDLYAYITESGNFSILQKRIGKNAVLDLETEVGELPTFAKRTEAYEVQYRAPTKKKS